MRIAKVVGRISLVRQHESVRGQRWLMVVPQDLAALDGRRPAAADEIIALDQMGAAEGDLIAISEGGEATFPFYPNYKPIDVYNACILDRIQMDGEMVERLIGPK